jgi:hypothetical protein
MNKTVQRKYDRFVDEYCVCLNSTRAAILAGFSKTTAHQRGHALLKLPYVQAAIKEKQMRIARVNDITRDELIEGYRNISQANITDYAKWDEEKIIWKPSSELTVEQQRRIKEIRESYSVKGQRTFSIVLHDAKAGLDGLAKLSGHIVERREHSGIGGKPIQHQSARLKLENLTTEEVEELKRIKQKMDEDVAVKGDFDGVA